MCGYFKREGDHQGQYVSNMENAAGDHKGPPPHIPAALAPTIHGPDMHRSIVGAGVVRGWVGTLVVARRGGTTTSHAIVGFRWGISTMKGTGDHKGPPPFHG